MLENGRKKYKLAIQTIKDHEANGWKFEKKITEIDPLESDLLVTPEGKEVESW